MWIKYFEYLLSLLCRRSRRRKKSLEYYLELPQFFNSYFRLILYNPRLLHNVCYNYMLHFFNELKTSIVLNWEFTTDILGRKFIKVKIFPEMVLFKAHMMFKCFFHLINAKEESLDLKSIILLVKKNSIFKDWYVVNTLIDVGMWVIVHASRNTPEREVGRCITGCSDLAWNTVCHQLLSLWWEGKKNP